MKLNDKVIEQLMQNLNSQERTYLALASEEIKKDYKTHFIRLFSTLNRRLSLENREKIISIPNPGDADMLIINNWSVLRLARVWLVSLIKDEKEAYFNFIDKLFTYADIQELVALYSSLSILDFPEIWQQRCQEGIRSNIGSVQQAIIENNKYPFYHLSQEAWNQLVLKSFFTEKNILNIYGLFEKNNQSLSESIIDYIYERDSANREIYALLWLLAKDNLPPRARNILLKSEVEFLEDIKKLEKKNLMDMALKLLEEIKSSSVCVQN